MKESDEERQHGLQLLNYVSGRNGVAKLAFERDEIGMKEWKNAAEVFETIAELERQNALALNKLFLKARDEKCVATEVFLGDMIKEQTINLDSTESLYKKVKAYSAMPGLLYHLDAQL